MSLAFFIRSSTKSSCSLRVHSAATRTRKAFPISSVISLNLSQNKINSSLSRLSFSTTPTFNTMAKKSENNVQSKWLGTQDPTSFARPEEAKVVDIFLKLNLDFDKHVLDGFVILKVERVKEDATSVFLDSKALSIKRVVDEDTGKPLEYTIGAPGFVGSCLEIKLPDGNKKLSMIKIDYVTSPQASGLQWLDPSMTAGKTRPYVFSHCEAIHCRSLVPLQDTPAVKCSFTAEISAPADLTVLMSAVRQGKPEENENGELKVHRFHQKIPVQSYLIAMAAGLIESRQVGPRSHVWSEKEYVDKAAWEFADTEKMLKEAENLCGPYVWGVYDILVLPPSFPFGGMENPCLTFATPTLLAGDRSLVNVIAHEIAHSWTGNLVTNKNFEHFWLNEGFTVFTERKIRGRIDGESARHFAGIGGWSDLEYQIDVMGKDNPLTSLVVNLTGIDPDDAFSTVPYEKGSAFLWYLEELIGGPEKMEPFLREYYKKFMYQSIDSFQFKQFFLDHFKNHPNVSKINWDDWFSLPGMPTIKPHYDESLLKVCEALANNWITWDENEKECPFNINDLKNFIPDQKVKFLALLAKKAPLPIKKLNKIQEVYDFNSMKNSEIRLKWVRLGLLSKWMDVVPNAIQFITEQGRMKFLRPIYRDLYNWEETRQLALDTFNKNQSAMMAVAVQGLEVDLHLKS